jgi:hypothetical protein
MMMARNNPPRPTFKGWHNHEGSMIHTAIRPMIAVLILAVILIAFDSTTVADNAPAAAPTTRQGGSITVTVVDSSNKPVAGAEVGLLRWQHRNHSTTQPASPRERFKQLPIAARGTTDGNGNFTFSDVPVGRYGVLALLKGTGHGHARVILAPSATGSPAANVTITLQPPQNHSGNGGKTPDPDGGNNNDPTTQPN